MVYINTKSVKNRFIMLINFSVKNYRTFRDRASLSLVASNYDKLTNVSDNIVQDTATGLSVLKSAVIYGANSSGKSNFLKALDRMGSMVLNSAQNSSTSELDVEPFLLSTETEKQPSYFEVLFLVDGRNTFCTASI